MPASNEHGDASVANTPNLFSEARPDDFGTFDTAATGDAGVAALAENLEYTLTVGQAAERFVAARRKPPSGRSIQRYCIEGRLAAQKIRTTFGSEWLINESSLMSLIEAEPIVTGDAGDATSVDMPSPISPPKQPLNFHVPDAVATGDTGDADEPLMATPTGERRTVAAVLIENAKLLAQVEGRDAIISELKEDRAFLREEVREARRTRDDVKNIAERTLDTLKAMVLGRAALPATPTGPVEATVIRPDEGQY